MNFTILNIDHRRLIIKLIFLMAILLNTVVLTGTTNALRVDDSCKKVEAVFARGSGTPLNEPNGEARRFFEQIENRLDSPSLIHKYELGTEEYGRYSYPAVDVDSFVFKNGIEAYLLNKVSAIEISRYGISVESGVIELVNYLSKRFVQCESYGSYYILGGYSQGAQVIGEALTHIPKHIRDRIVFVGLFGDPKLYFPEGKPGTGILGAPTPPPACQGKNLSSYRRLIGNCWLDEGIFGGRKSYLPQDMTTKTGLWCRDKDFVCGTSNVPWENSGHGEYKLSGQSIDSAAQEAATRAAHAIANEPKPDVITNDQTPRDKINTSYNFGTGITGQDIVYVLDTAGISNKSLEEFKHSIVGLGPSIIESNGRFVIVHIGMPVIDTNPHENYPDMSDGILNHGQWYIDNIDFLDNIHADSPGYPLASLYFSLPAIDWRAGAAKSVIFITTQSNYTSPDPLGITNEMLADLALKIDPVNIYPVVPVGSESSYQDIARLTSGQVTTYGTEDGDLGAATNSALNKVLDRPVARLKLSKYIAETGQEITFDASDSYSIDGEITTYDWDFNGDNVFDETTTTPAVNHTYGNAFDGLMQVRVTSSSGLIANMSATVQVGTFVSPVLPPTPRGVTVEVLKTDGDNSTARLSWLPVENSDFESLVLSINGIVLGLITPGQTSIDISDINRTVVNDISLNVIDNTGRVGRPAVVSLDALRPILAVLNTLPTGLQKTTAKASVPTNGTLVTNHAASVTLASYPEILGSHTQNPEVSTLNTGNTLATTPDSIHDSSPHNSSWYWWLAPGVIVVAGLTQAIRLGRR